MTGPLHVEVVRGRPTEEEAAALVSVLLGLAAATRAETGRPRRVGWREVGQPVVDRRWAIHPLRGAAWSPRAVWAEPQAPGTRRAA